MTAKLRVDHRNLNMLYNHAADITHRLPGVVRNYDIGSELLAMVVNLAVKSHF